MSELFLRSVVQPIILAFLIRTVAGMIAYVARTPKRISVAELRKVFLEAWRNIASLNVAVALLLLPVSPSLDWLGGSSVSLLLWALFDDNVRRKGKRAAKLLGDKTRRIIEAMRERATPRVLKPVPGLG